MHRQWRYVFGPVPSRRLGSSLGVDLVPPKTCTQNCVYCQLGPTPHPTLTRAPYVPIAEVRAELQSWMAAGGRADCVTLAGSGEPTLHTGFGEVLTFVRHNTNLPTVLLSNGTLFSLPEVREAACGAHIVKLTLSAWDQTSFERIHRPASGTSFTAILAGYRSFREIFTGRLWIEVFVVPGFNADSESLSRIAALVTTIQPDRVHLNTAVRRPAEEYVAAVAPENLNKLATLFNPPAEIMASFSSQTVPVCLPSEADLLAMLRRHPSTVAELAAGFRLDKPAILRLLAPLIETGRVCGDWRDGETYYRAVPSVSPSRNGL